MVANNNKLSQKNRSAIQLGIKFLKSHPSVEKISEPTSNPETTAIEVEAFISVNLPSRWKASGKSPNGVMALEPVTFSFPTNYPICAPEISLRKDFDRSLPHIQPGSPEGPIIPCLYEGDINELLHASSLWTIIDQLVTWLDKAVLGNLIDPDQGWEPIRRDILEDLVVANSCKLVSQKEVYRFFHLQYLRIPYPAKSNNTRMHFLRGQIGESLNIKKSNFQGLFQGESPNQRMQIGRSLAITVMPSNLHVADQYRPEDITDLGSLRHRAEEYGCLKNLNRAFSSLNHCAQQFKSIIKFPIIIVLYALRPINLIGQLSKIELVPYLVDIGMPELFPDGDKTPVYPVGHLESIAPGLLQTFSGENLSLPEARNVALVGCGSLGSKIAIHMARSGVAPTSVIDKQFLSPHNAARHALLPGMQLSWVGAKSETLSSAMEGLGQLSEPHKEDVTRVLNDSELLKKLFPKKTWGIINATASLAVSEAFGSVSPENLRARVIETSLLANGAVGLMTIEGPARNPNTIDLTAAAYEAIRSDTVLRKLVFEDEDPMRHQPIGQGCGSTTMVIPDAKISLFAASMAQGISTLRTENFPKETGRIFLGQTTDNGMGLHWTCLDVQPVHIISVDNEEWTVRLMECAHQKILKDCAAYAYVETGGILIGRISEAQQAFLVTDVLPAPQDSVRSNSEFILGIQGVLAQLEEYRSSCRSTLYCLGTWHSHLNNSGPSACDLQTATKMASASILPSVSLIKTQSAYRAIFASNHTS
jgi:Prokaryotic E2 family A/Prokaryotic homologs of the JAB domain